MSNMHKSTPTAPDGAPPPSRGRARHLRKNATEAERKLWFELRGFKSFGHYFRRQVPIGRYIADFACLKVKLIVELDGSHHAEGIQLSHDKTRDDWLKTEGFNVLRFWNRDVFRHKQDVLNTILAALPLEGGGGHPGKTGMPGGGDDAQIDGKNP